ncbi:uncharacterized protein LOC115891552 [Sitophilus oryzae]|uniref:Uncharacterized protein LOC115891552 n=1 Tax=Sitophilus oryzae TaxID=7048 RepID=A0A6J2YYJ3_SITOR|nr:uncharacterized protein LOC115891552 [Sitophilus oryzae]
MPEPGEYFLPHHCVFKESSTTTRLRIVFDGSCKTNTGLSLNDIMMVGPTIQEDIFAILLRFRIFDIVIKADIAKMYRQVLVSESDRKLQKIFWRNKPSDQLDTYQLNTVTYGTSAAAFLAIRCLNQLAYEHKESHPEASEAILKCFYVDDLLYGGTNISDIIRVKNDINAILQKAGFELRKWVSNDERVFQQINKLKDCTLGEHENSKTLGLKWIPAEDQLSFEIGNFDEEITVTKRTILSMTAQLFDPLGLLSLVIIIPKVMLQRLWQANLHWEESVPLELHTRCGACVYLRTVDVDDKVLVNLLCSKSRVAPVKIISIPKLELCAAVLLAELTQRVFQALNMDIQSVHYWCDSKIVLSWISASAHKWKTFVANKVARIQELSNPNEWHYVHTSDNPADLISRGLNEKILINTHLWWNGPSWLRLNTCDWPAYSHKIDNIPEERVEACLNSRPLSPLSSDPNDLLPITPAHFLIGETLMSQPEPDLTNAKENLLSKLQQCQQMVQHFWNRWSKEYISELQIRSKWKQSFPNVIKPGILVIVKEDNNPPLKWQLERVVGVHPGADNVIRAVSIKTSRGTIQRPVMKICVLPEHCQAEKVEA